MAQEPVLNPDYDIDLAIEGYEYNWTCAVCLQPAKSGVALEFQFIENTDSCVLHRFHFHCITKGITKLINQSTVHFCLYSKMVKSKKTPKIKTATAVAIPGLGGKSRQDLVHEANRRRQEKIQAAKEREAKNQESLREQRERKAGKKREEDERQKEKKEEEALQ